jgi:lipopolysaccharide/colanic/teichoic acid biosynthesis glycosyltransferase
MAKKDGMFPASKRAFDLIVIFYIAPLWLLTLAVCTLGLLVLEGRPVLYASNRRVHGDKVIRIIKFRTMRRDADRVFNRDAVPVSTQRFLNLPPDSPLYTPIGRLIERCMFTELPQIWHVLMGDMSLVGNRPLPVNVVESLREIYPDVDLRFQAPAGLTGPVQLVGRAGISDCERLALECAYVMRVCRSSCVLLDLKILILTVAASMSSRWRLTFEQAMDMIDSDRRGQPSSNCPRDTFMPRKAGGDHPNTGH